jgi:hypothetical protein
MVAALAALQRKKMLEKDLDKWTSTKNTIEQQVFALENANINLETMKAMQAGASAMKGIHGSLYPLLPPSSSFPPPLPNTILVLGLCWVGGLAWCSEWILMVVHLRRLTRLWMTFETKWPFPQKLAKP